MSDRSSWPVRKFRLGEEPGDDLSAVTTPEERLGMMWTLARDAWASSGREIPEYTREETPVRKIPPTGSDGDRMRY